MELPGSSALVARLEVLDEIGSTNTELVRLAPGWPAPAGSSLAISVLLRPAVPTRRLGWVSLAAGAAMTEALAGLGVAARAKWPNDVLVDGRKVCGVLAETLTDGTGVVVGAGLNH